MTSFFFFFCIIFLFGIFSLFLSLFNIYLPFCREGTQKRSIWILSQTLMICLYFLFILPHRLLRNLTRFARARTRLHSPSSSRSLNTVSLPFCSHNSRVSIRIYKLCLWVFFSRGGEGRGGKKKENGCCRWQARLNVRLFGTNIDLVLTGLVPLTAETFFQTYFHPSPSLGASYQFRVLQLFLMALDRFKNESILDE